MAKKSQQKEFVPRDHMLKAIEVMNQSVPEPRADGAVSPKVGAVLVKADGKVETACRGELRYGDHAEFSLLERKNRANILEGSILFTTLEPCAPGARTQPKLSCAERIFNARIKEVWVGIEDPFPTVAGKGIKFLEAHGIKVKMFDADLQLEIEKEERDFIEWALKKALEPKTPFIPSVLESAIPAVDFSSLSKLALQKFIVESNLEFEPDSPEFCEFLTNLGILEAGPNGTFHPTGIGYLLFGKNPRAKFPSASLKASADYGGGKIEPQSFDQPLVLVPSLVEDWLKKVLPLSKDTSKFKRKDVSDFPPEVIREAVINAIVHRDYNIEGAKALIEIDRDKIVIKSPGAPLPSISIEQLNSFRAPSLSRNPIVTYVFNLMGYVEETGFGMRSFRRLNEEFGLPLPIYSYEEPFLVLTFSRSADRAHAAGETGQLADLRSDEISVLDFIRLNGPVKRMDIQKALQLSNPKIVERRLKRLLDFGLIVRRGAGPQVTYDAKKDIK